jgi:hypothetical protein
VPLPRPNNSLRTHLGTAWHKVKRCKLASLKCVLWSGLSFKHARWAALMMCLKCSREAAHQRLCSHERRGQQRVDQRGCRRRIAVPRSRHGASATSPDYHSLRPSSLQNCWCTAVHGTMGACVSGCPAVGCVTCDPQPPVPTRQHAHARTHTRRLAAAPGRQAHPAAPPQAQL